MAAAKKRRTESVRSEVLNFALNLRERAVPGPVIISQLMRRFELSRPQAYRYLARAGEVQGEAKLAPPEHRELTQMLLNSLAEAFIDAQIEGDRKELPKISKEIREVLKTRGVGSHWERNQQEEMVHQTYARNGDPQGSENQ
jgi:hypothetical protein